MSFDAYLVAFGLARTLIEHAIAPGVAYQLLLATAVCVVAFAAYLVDAVLLHRPGHLLDWYDLNVYKHGGADRKERAAPALRVAAAPRD